MLTRKERRVVMALSLTAFVLRIPLAFRSDALLASSPYTDDAFYLFSIARHLAHTGLPSVDGAHLTNGFQPLIVLCYTPIFWLCGNDVWLAVRWTFVLNGIIAALSVWAAAAAMRTMQCVLPIEHEQQSGNCSAPIAGAAIWTWTYSLFRQTTNGLETGLFSLLLLIAIGLYANAIADKPFPSSRAWSIVGIVLGLTVLARIDAAILVAILVAILLWKRKIVPALLVGGCSVIVSAPWWIYNWVSFGNLMPTSGQAENSWPMPPLENIEQAMKALSELCTLVIYPPGSLGPIILSIWVFIAIVFLSIIFFRTPVRSIVREFRWDALVPFLLFSVALVAFYTFFFRAPHFLARYFQPLRIVWSLAIAAFAAWLWQRKSNAVRLTITLVASVSVLFTAYSYVFFFIPKDGNDFYAMGKWVEEHPAEKIGMLQSGIASFIAPNVINLDGKVNTAALRAHQQGQLAEYLRSERFTYIADYKPFIEDIASLAKNDELFFDSVGMVGRIQLMKLRP